MPSSMIPIAYCVIHWMRPAYRFLYCSSAIKMSSTKCQTHSIIPRIQVVFLTPGMTENHSVITSSALLGLVLVGVDVGRSCPIGQLVWNFFDVRDILFVRICIFERCQSRLAVGEANATHASWVQRKARHGTAH